MSCIKISSKKTIRIKYQHRKWNLSQSLRILKQKETIW